MKDNEQFEEWFSEHKSDLEGYFAEENLDEFMLFAKEEFNNWKDWEETKNSLNRDLNKI